MGSHPAQEARSGHKAQLGDFPDRQPTLEARRPRDATRQGWIGRQSDGVSTRASSGLGTSWQVGSTSPRPIKHLQTFWSSDPTESEGARRPSPRPKSVKTTRPTLAVSGLQVQGPQHVGKVWGVPEDGCGKQVRRCQSAQRLL